jgi:tetratricopeptide (TPR) repeat protein
VSNALHGRLAPIAAVVIWFTAWGCAPCFAQEKPQTNPAPVIRQDVSLEQPPFDKLELMAFAVGAFSDQYVMHEIGRRGLSFVPDAEFLKALNDLGKKGPIVNAVKNATARAVHAATPQREASYQLLISAAGEMRKRQFASADQRLQDALALAPDSATLHLAYANDLLLLKKFTSAEEQCRRSIQLWPEDAEAHSMLATSLSLQNRDSDAIPEAREALRIFPAYKTALISLAMALTRSRRFEEAVPVLREAIARTPELPQLRKLLGTALFHTGDTDGSIEQLSKYVGVQPNDAEAHYYLGVSLRAKGREEEALAQFKAATTIEPANPLYASVADPEGAKKAAQSSGSEPDIGSVSGNVYTNQFFGFSFEFPKGWTVLDAGVARATVDFGGAIIANGDPMLQDAQHAAARITYPLFYATEGLTKDGAISIRSVQIRALDVSADPNLRTPEEYLTGLATLHSQGIGIPVEPAGKPEQLQVGGGAFWRLNMSTRVGSIVVSDAAIVAVQKGYLLMFIVAGPDAASRDDLVRAVQSVHFVEKQ